MKRIVVKVRNVKRFYLLLPIYRSLLGKFIYFKLDNDEEELEKIVKALNIKNYKKRIEYVYDEACNYIDLYYKDVKNICGFKNDKCYAQRNIDKCNGCCRCCKYQNKSNCPTKNLACKLFYCSDVRERYKVIELDDVKILKVFSWRQRKIVKVDYFSLREDVINDLKYNSLIIGIIRIYYRLIRSYFWYKNNSKVKK